MTTDDRSIAARRPRANRFLQPTLALCAGLALAGAAHAQDAAALHAKFDALQERLAHNAYGRPLVLQSTQSGDHLEGEIYARVDQPFSALQKGLQGTDNWCGILILHLNVKMCHAQPAGLDMALGRKYDQPVEDAYRLHFDYKPVADGADYLRTELTSADGPLGTKDYRIAVEAAPLDAGHTMLHMSYAYGFGFTARVAMNTYLSTVGAEKVGFSVDGKDADGKPSYVGGVRGLVERNTMRYYLAIDDYVAAPAPGQLEQRLNTWFDATERYPRQLHEMEKADYIAMKKVEAKR
ncbi:MAG TPA: hypothetical protein VIP05_28360 [Burkholderiaceae bacterium]